MKSIRLIVALLVCSVAFPACQNAPSERTVAFQTLSSLGSTAKAGLDSCAILLKNGQITVAEWQRVSAFYTNRWQPAFTLAVQTARSDLGPASPDLVSLATQFASLVSSYTTRP